MALSTIPFSGLGADASNQGVNFRNLIINGDMSIAQRGTSFTGITTNTYSLDRWTTEGDDCTLTISQSTDTPSNQYFKNSLKMDVTTANSSRDADDIQVISTRFEGQMLQHLKYGSSQAQSVTLSFWCKNTQAGTYMVRILADNGGRHISKSYTVNSANTWEKKIITFEGDTAGTINNDNSRAYRVQWILDAGTTYTSGTLATSWEASTNANRAVGITTGWIDSTSNDFYLTGCQLEVGTSASEFEFLPYDVNLRRCQRYYQLIKGFNGNGAGSNDKIQVSITYPTPMRASPTLGVLATGGGNGLLKFTNGSSDFNQSSFGTNDQARQSDAFFGLFTGFSVTSGNLYTRAFDDGDYLELDGEL